MQMKRQKGRVSEVPLQLPPWKGDFAIVSCESGKLTSKHIETAIMTMKRKRPLGTTLHSHLEANLCVSSKPAEVRMGKGKGSINQKIARVRENTVLFTIEKGVGGDGKYKEMLNVVCGKLPLRSLILKG